MSTVSASLGSLEEPLVPQTSIVKRARTEEGAVATQAVPVEDITNRVRVKVKRSTDVVKDNPLVFNPTPAVVVSGGPVLSDGGLLEVRGNSKVMRCPRCNTFVKKGSIHTEEECNARIQRKAAKRGSLAGISKARKRIRLTPKRRKALEAFVTDATSYATIVKLAPRLEKWIMKKEKKLTKPSKKLFATMLTALRDRPDAKKIKTNFRKAGLVK